jgi:hypothetical protein
MEGPHDGGLPIFTLTETCARVDPAIKENDS